MSGAIATTKLKVSISDTTACDTIAEYDALTWVKIGNVLDVGEFGPQYQEITYTTIDDGLVFRLKGALDNGMFSLTLARKPSDAGQADVIAALDDSLSYNIKVEPNDKPAGVGAKGTRFCFPAKVFSYRNQFGDANQVVRTVVNVGIDGELVEGVAGT